MCEYICRKWLLPSFSWEESSYSLWSNSSILSDDWGWHGWWIWAVTSLTIHLTYGAFSWFLLTWSHSFILSSSWQNKLLMLYLKLCVLLYAVSSFSHCPQHMTLCKGGNNQKIYTFTFSLSSLHCNRLVQQPHCCRQSIFQSPAIESCYSCPTYWVWYNHWSWAWHVYRTTGWRVLPGGCWLLQTVLRKTLFLLLWSLTDCSGFLCFALLWIPTYVQTFADFLERAMQTNKCLQCQDNTSGCRQSRVFHANHRQMQQ